MLLILAAARGLQDRPDAADSGCRPWEPGLPAICRGPAVKPYPLAVCRTDRTARVWLPLLASDRLALQPVSNELRLPDRQGDDGQRRVLSCAGGELAAVGNEQIGDFMALSVFIADAVLRLFTHAAGAQVVGRGVRRHAKGVHRPD